MYTLEELAKAINGHAIGSATVDLACVQTDSRTLDTDSFFVALKGDNFDGHDFIAQAVEKGARAVLVEKNLPHINIPQLVVHDTLKALGDLAHFFRQQQKKPVIAITGSNGKTTTKELTAQVLSVKSPVHRTYGNLNNLIGVPLTLLRWPAQAYAAVVEMGMNQLGEIARYCEIAEPDIGVITNVAKAHVGKLLSVQNIAKAKGELFAGLNASSIAVINQDDALVTEICEPLCKKGVEKIRFGTTSGVDVQLLEAVQHPAHLALTFLIRGKKLSCTLPLVGTHNALNTAAALAVALAMQCDLEQACEQLKQVQLPYGRLRVVTHKTWHVIDDTYNANPASMQAALTTLKDLSGKARRIAVLGSMFELGDEAQTLHEQVATFACKQGVDVLYAVGEFAEVMVQAATKQGLKNAKAFASNAEIPFQLQDNDWILLKGSRGMRMERYVQKILEL